jgi:hypothetical protein
MVVPLDLRVARSHAPGRLFDEIGCTADADTHRAADRSTKGDSKSDSNGASGANQHRGCR